MTSMANRGQGSPQLIQYVHALENRSSYDRGKQVLAELAYMGLEPVVQTCRWTRSRNIIVDFDNDPIKRHLLFSAHYDATEGSPGANDNASGVAVLLGLCNELRHLRKPVRIVFFDREESWLRTPVLSFGLLGSLSYVYKTNLRLIDGVYNLEFCGQGDFIAIWPVKGKEIHLDAVRRTEKVASSLGLKFGTAHVPWLFFSSDHLSFRMRGVPNAISLSLLPSSQVSVLERLLNSLSIIKLLSGRKPKLTEPFQYIHSKEDTSSRLNESSLRLMLSLLIKLVSTAKV